jgi:ubiquitin-conjugating enzyme E2 O
VEVEAVDVEWMQTRSEGSEALPANICAPSDLVELNYFAHSHWQIGERVICPFEVRLAAEKQRDKEDVTEMLNKLTLSVAEDKENNNAKDDQSEVKNYMNDCAAIVCTRTLVDVRWQDNTITRGVPAIELEPADNLLDEDFWPEDFVLEKGNEISTTYGVLKKVDTKQRVAEVTWKNEESGTEEKTEEVPMYLTIRDVITYICIFSLVDHPDWSYRISDVVIRLPSGSEEKSETSQSWVGEIINIENGMLYIHWANKQTTTALPSQVFKIETEDEDEDDFESYYDSDEEDEEEEEEEEEEDEDIDEDDHYEEQIVQPAFIEKPANAWWHEENETGHIDFKIPDELPEHTDINNNNSVPTQSSQPSQHHEGFDVTEQVTDHHYQTKEVKQTSAKFCLHSIKVPTNVTKLASLVLKEWDLLKKSLPEGIYIMVYEDRMV